LLQRFPKPSEMAVCQMPLTEEGHLHQSDVAVFKGFPQREGECFPSVNGSVITKKH
jgi:hypothetical protein